MSKQVEVPEAWIGCTDCGWSLADLAVPAPEPLEVGVDCPACGIPMVEVGPVEAIYKHFSDRLLGDEAVTAILRAIHPEGQWAGDFLTQRRHLKENLPSILEALQATSTPEVDRG